MTAFAALRDFFSREREVAAVYLYGTYADERTWPDSDIEIALLFPESADEQAIDDYLERLAGANPLQDAPGILMPFALNTHVLPVIYEILASAHPLVVHDPAAVRAFAARAGARVEQERAAMLQDARDAIVQARALGATDAAPRLARPARPLDPLRIGWRLARILTAAAVLEPATRDAGEAGEDPDQLGHIIGWFSNAAGAATGIAKAALSLWEIPRPSRRWQVFLPLADAGAITTELALQLGAVVEARWQLLTRSGLADPERIAASVRAALAPLLTFARLAAWYCDLPGGSEQRVH
ncbi:MAG: nucleotidyltransferase domain-containing protein [Armatimonadota bacterium]|nr:nucleotidyltransferase domain-containing protein [Armatimonadota bacterium]MDR7403289.1 nucleotidyltransferase domain-containing protein [Armatimonadota bacterium]MDR7437641.1 nucleotidyltransferase domain-containing protein [Armatimonadota bacterium]MDR7507867.1 nucleotidyltransferase domain-containing protein [Armatimonadota bacterium]MDR7516868.1 nucleotidyltransferase domain-containing protein [Armatimonadota bacterium]